MGTKLITALCSIPFFLWSCVDYEQYGTPRNKAGDSGGAGGAKPIPMGGSSGDASSMTAGGAPPSGGGRAASNGGTNDGSITAGRGGTTPDAGAMRDGGADASEDSQVPGAGGAPGSGGRTAVDAAPDAPDGISPTGRTPAGKCETERAPVGTIPLGADAAAPGAFHDYISFNQPTDTAPFLFWTPEPFINGPGLWTWVSDPYPSLEQQSNVQAGIRGSATGTYAVYCARVVRNGRISAHIQTADDDSAGLLFRYQDEWHYYRFAVFETGWEFVLGDGARARRLLCAGCGDQVEENIDWSLGHDLSIEGDGPQIWISLDGKMVGYLYEPTYAEGRVGLFTRAAMFVHFNEVEVTGY